MRLDRCIITHREDGKIEPPCVDQQSGPGRTGGDTRLFVRAVFWIFRAGAKWHDLPRRSGKWHSVYRQFRDWGVEEIFKRIFNALAEEPDREMVMIPSW